MKRFVIGVMLMFAVGTCPSVDAFRIERRAVVPVASRRPIQTTPVEFGSDRWTVKAEETKVEEFLGRKSLLLKRGNVWLKDVEFENGVIEVDLAPSNERTFLGVTFRSESPDKYEVFYIRPHKSGLDDALQYAPAFGGGAAWQLFSGKGFTNAFVFPKDRWLHVKLVVSGHEAKVFLDNLDKPALEVPDLKLGHSKGSIGLFAVGGRFADFKYRLEKPSGTRAATTVTIPPGILTNWELSEAFTAAERDPEALPAPADLRRMKWESATVEPPGMVVIDRYRQTPNILPPYAFDPTARMKTAPERKVVFARTIINSDKEQIKRMSLGYSDEATVFLNGKPLFTGKSAFRFRDPGFLGIMDVENDALYLPLKKGRNELVLAVSEYFGGWGFICRLDEK